MPELQPDDPISKEVAKLLTHVEASVREKTVQQIGKWLKQREKQCKPDPIDDLEFQKLWKALYYCFWMTDKTPIQHEMGRTLSSTLSSNLSLPENIHRFFTNFFAVLRREWVLIDYLRLNKFLSLVRQMVNSWLATLQLSAKSKVDDNILAFVEHMREGVLFPHQPDGLRMQIAFVFLPELCKVTSGLVSEPVLRELLSPFFCVLLDPPTDAMFQATLKDVFHVLDTNQYGEEDSVQTFVNLDKGKIGQCLFEMAAEDETLTSGVRKQLYTLAKRFQRSGTSTSATVPSMKSILSPSVMQAKKLKQQRLSDATKSKKTDNDDEDKEDEAPPSKSNTSAVKKKLKMDDDSADRKKANSKNRVLSEEEEMDMDDDDDDEEEEEETKPNLVKPSSSKKNKPKGQIFKLGEKPVEGPFGNFTETPKSSKKSLTTTTPKENNPPKKVVVSTSAAPVTPAPSMSSKKTPKSAAVHKEVVPSALNESFVSTASSTSSKKNVRFSHKDIMKIPAITKKMKETPRSSSDLGVPKKGLLKKTTTATPVKSASKSKRL